MWANLDRLAAAASLQASAVHMHVHARHVRAHLHPAGEAALQDSVLLSSVQFNVRDFGAMGDGSTDDAAAVQKALDTMLQKQPQGGATLFFPKVRVRKQQTAHESCSKLICDMRVHGM